MKKTLLMISLALALVFLTACKKNEGNQNTNPSISPEPTKAVTDSINQNVTPTEPVKQLTIKDYYPIRQNTKYIYDGEGSEYAAYTEFIDYTSENRIQTRTNNGGTEFVRVLEYKDGQLTRLLSREECYYRESFLDTQDEDGEIILKEPLVVGTEWTTNDNRKRFISNVNVEITTGTGTYEALEVTTEGTEDTIYDYYTPGVGLVKSVFRAAGLDITSTLSKIEDNVPFNQTIRVYFPNVDTQILYIESLEVPFYTNDDTKTKLADVLKTKVNNQYDSLISENTSINNLFLDKDNIVNIDFTKEFVSDMNAGANYEDMILQCITNTVGDYYGVNEVYITVAGKPYESGHISMREGETFQVNFNNVVD